MKKVFGVLLLIGAVAITSCGPSRQDRATEQARLDSIAAAQEQALQDSIEAAEAAAAAAAAAVRQEQAQEQVQPAQPTETRPSRRGDTELKDDERPTRRGDQTQDDEESRPARRGS